LSIYVVTGGAGFIGSHLTTRLGRAGHTVRVLDNFTGVGARERAAMLADVPHVTITEGDVRDADICRQVCVGADIVLHQAAEASVPQSIEEPAECAAINVGGTINMLSAAQTAGTVTRFVFASSCAVYGDTPAMSKHEASLVDPISPYASSKLSGEYFCRNFFRLHGLQTVALRYFNVYGPGQTPEGAYAAVIPKFLTAIAQGGRPVIYGDGEQSRDFIYIDDIVEANLRAASGLRGTGGKVFNIGSGQRVSLNQLIERLQTIMGHPIEVERHERRAGDIKHSRADVAAAAGLLQFAPSVSLDDGLARTLQWYQAQHTPREAMGELPSSQGAVTAL
jgi:UDP-N-acetylglucosamine 4-epimerase